MSRRHQFILGLAAVGVLVAVATETVRAQEWWRRGRRSRQLERRLDPKRDIFPGDKFTFCRIRYRSPRGYWGWNTDYPDSDLNFSIRLSELTTIDVTRDKNGEVLHTWVDLTDEKLFDYPWIYIVEPGGLYLSSDEAEQLRKYLLRGGFLMVDDFWGEEEWANWVLQISKVFPPEQYPMEDIPLSHEIFHCVFDIKEVPQVPAIGIWKRTGGTSERFDSQTPHCKGIWDKDGRLMVVVLHNTDLGDGWEEEARDPEYFREFSVKKAYPLGINIVVYAMTH